MKLAITFTSAHIDTACSLFAEVACSNETACLVEKTRTSATYTLDDDLHIRDFRAWGADSIGCGLVTLFSCNYAE